MKEQAPIEAAEIVLECPSCGAVLSGSPAFEVERVCPACRRHFAMPARERLALLVDEGSFVETNAEVVSVAPLVFRDGVPGAAVPEAREGSGVAEAVVTGVGAIAGQSAVLVLLDAAYLGGNIGVLAGEKIVLAMELARVRRLPLIAICSGGAARTQEGMLSLVQLARIAGAAARLHRAGVPFISVLTHPTTGGVYAGLANQADLIFAEPGARIGFNAVRGGGGAGGVGTNTAEFLLASGMIDAVVDRAGMRDHLAALLDLFAVRGVPRAETSQVERGGASPPPAAALWETVAFARHPERPTASDYIRALLPTFIELHGDRTAGDDPALVCGLGRLEGASVAIIAQERGRGAERDLRRGGRMGAAGYRKALRLMRLAGHLELPLVSLVDTPGAMGDAAAEAEGIGFALGRVLGMMSLLPVPIVSVVIGEAGGVGALALGIGDRMLMLQHALYAVSGFEPAAPQPLGRIDPSEPITAPRLTARDCLRLGVIDAIVPEPEPAAHADPAAAAEALRLAVAQALAGLGGVGPRRLLDERARRVRAMGLATAEGQEAARLELRELEELRRSLGRSLNDLRDDLRDRWESRNLTLPNLPARPTLPNLPTLPSRPALPSLSRLHRHRPDLSDLAGRLAQLRGGAASTGTVVLHQPTPETGIKTVVEARPSPADSVPSASPEEEDR